MIHPVEALRDYAVGELTAAEQPAVEEHVAGCGECALELDRLRVTMAALRTLPDCDIPQRIGFVSDKVFEPSAVARFLSGFWNSAARLGFVSACVLAAALLVSAYHRAPAEARTVVNAANQDVSKQVNDAVTKALGQIRTQIRTEDAHMAQQMTQAAIEAVNRKYEHEYQSRMIAVEESYTVLQKRLSNSLLASNERPSGGDGQ